MREDEDLDSLCFQESGAMDYTFLKRQLRTAAVHKRSGIELDRALWCAEEIVARFNEMSLPENPVFSAYWPMKTELDVRPLMFSLFNRGFTVSLPVVSGKDEPLLFRRWEPDARLVEGPYGTEQPDEKYETVTPTVLLLPLLALLVYYISKYNLLLKKIKREKVYY